MSELAAQVDAVAAEAGMDRDQRWALVASLRTLLSFLASHALPGEREQETVDVHREDVDLFVRASARTSLARVPPAEVAELRATAPIGGSVDVTLDDGRLITVVQAPVPDRRAAPHWS